MVTYLDGIVAWHRARAAGDERDLEVLAAEALRAPEPRPFAERLAPRRAAREIAVIAEIKRRSPSRGELAPDLDAASVARDYEAGGAACLSVLTDGPHFGGSAADLAAARGATSLPVLRKDFTVSVRDLYDSRIMGADAALLIVAALTDDELAGLVATCQVLSLAALVEVHDEVEARRAIAAGASIIGVNQRDLRTFEVDRRRALSVGAHLPADAVKVAESGIAEVSDLGRLRDAGFDAVLVGETVVTAGDRVAAVRALATAGAAV